MYSFSVAVGCTIERGSLRLPNYKLKAVLACVSDGGGWVGARQRRGPMDIYHGTEEECFNGE